MLPWGTGNEQEKAKKQPSAKMQEMLYEYEFVSSVLVCDGY